MTAFTTNENRDASASIAGFVYQIELTILRWLDLQAEQALELERGEDIDKLSSRLAAGVAGAITILERTNEQVKLRSARITLASAEAREALANFHKQRTDNKEWMLFFRFTTTAAPTYEQKNRFPSNTPAILRWEALRKGEITDPAEQADVLNRLRRILVDLRRPKDFNDKTWQAWRDFITDPTVATDEALRDFIGKFEWGYGTQGLPETHELVLGKIAARTGWARPLCLQLYRKLLSRVAMLLSQPGEKRLTPDMLQGFIDHPVLEKSEASIVSNLQLLLVGFEDLKALLHLAPHEHVEISPTEYTIKVRVDPDAQGNVPTTDDVTFSDTPEGEAARRAFIEMLLVDNSFETDMEHIQLPVSDGVRSLQPLTGRVVVSIYRPGPKPELFCRVEFRRLDDPEQSAPCFVYEFVRFTSEHQGLLVTLFENQEDAREIGLHIGLALSDKRIELALDFQIRRPIEVQNLAKAMALQDCLSNPCSITFVNLRDAQRRITLRAEQASMAAPSPGIRSAVQLLARIGRKVGVPITWPARRLTHDEAFILDKLNAIERTGKWVSLTRDANTHVIGGQAFRRSAAGTGAAASLWVPAGEDSVELFGTTIPLGRVRYLQQHENGATLAIYPDWEAPTAEREHHDAS